MTATNFGFFCDYCNNYIQNSEKFYHNDFCKGKNMKRDKFSEFEFKDRLLGKSPQTQFKAKEDNYYNLAEGVVTFGKNQKFIETFSNSKEKANLRMNNNDDYFKDTFKKHDENFDTFKNHNFIKDHSHLNDVNERSSNQSNLFKKNESLANSNSNFYNSNFSNVTNNNIENTFISTAKNKNPFLQNQISVNKDYSGDNLKNYGEEKSFDAKEKSSSIGILNEGTENNAFLNVVIQTIWNMKIFRNYILYEFNISENDYKYRILAQLKNLIRKLSQNINLKSKPHLEVDRLRNLFSEFFQSRRKFLIEHPDDPIDCLFAILNCFHSNFVNSTPNEISEKPCNFECVSHKFFWIDLYRQDECECQAISKRVFSFHNYIFNIPLDKVLEFIENPNPEIELNKRIKVKANKNFSSESNSLIDFKGKLFSCLRSVLNNFKIPCPSGRCQINQTKKKFVLSNFPIYFIASLQNQNVFSNSASDVLKGMILIPGLFDISNIFEHSKSRKVFYEFIGGICSNNHKSYSCFFLNQNKEWVQYIDDKINIFKNWYEFVLNSVKFQEMPLLLYYQLQEKYEETNFDFLNEDIIKLERFAKNIDNLSQIVQNKFRPFEDLLKTEVSVDLRNSQETNKFKRMTKTESNNSANSSGEYRCSICNHKNKVENKFCLKCNKNNEIVIEKIASKTNEVDTSENKDFDNKKHSNFNTLENKDKVFEVSKSKGFFNKNEEENNNEKLYRNEFKETFKSNDTPQFIDKNSLNMPKQIKNSEKELTNNYLNEQKSSPEKKKSAKGCSNCKMLKCICSIKEIKIINNEEKVKNNKNIESQEKLKIKKLNSNEWECENCKYINPVSNSKCKYCKGPNKQPILANNIKEKELTPKTPDTLLPHKKDTEIHRSPIEVNQNQFNNRMMKEKCVCFVIDNESLFVNNQCKICKRNRIEKPSKTPPKKLLTNEVQNSREYQFITNNLIPSKDESNKNKLIKSNSKEKLSPSKDRKNSEKKYEFQENKTKGFVNENKSKGLIQAYSNNIQKEKIVSNVKPTLNPNENNLKKGQYITSNYTNLSQKQPITNSRISDLSKAPNFARMTKSNINENVFSSNKVQNFK